MVVYIHSLFFSLISRRKRTSLYYHLNCEICAPQPKYSLPLRKLLPKLPSLIISSPSLQAPFLQRQACLFHVELCFIWLCSLLKPSLLLSLAQVLGWMILYNLISIPTNLQKWNISLLMTLTRVLSQIQWPFLCHHFLWSFWNRI